MQHVALKVREDHELRRPFCGHNTLDVAFPMSQNGIGFDDPALTDEERAEVNREMAAKDIEETTLEKARRTNRSE